MKTEVSPKLWLWEYQTQKLHSACQPPGHNKNKCRNAPCKGIDFCHNRDKHPEFQAEIQDLTKVVKDLGKMQRLRANLMCLSQLEKEPPNSFFEQCVYTAVEYISCGFSFRSTFFGFCIFMRSVGWNN